MAVFKNGIFAYDNGKPVTPQSLGISLSGIQTCQQFFTSASISDNTQKYAVYALVGDLETYSIWDKMKAVYPMVGQADVSSSFEINLKDPSTFRGTFYGGWEFTNTGAKPNGSTGYMDTGLVPLNDISNAGNVHMSFYSRTNQASSATVEIGVLDGVSGDSAILAIKSNISGQQSRYDLRLFCLSGNINVAAPTDTLGFACSTKSNSNVVKGFFNNNLLGSITVTNSLPNYKIVISARNISNSVQNFSSKECAFASIGDGLTDTEAANFYTAVQRFQTTLGRQV